MASYFQAYFRSSSMPKRLLQYALSRLEIVDTDALDLDNLDISWGKNSKFEFRDVGLRLQKLETLLQLPPSLELIKARILLLRLTIPVDIYSSPIVVEVDGVDCQLRVKSQFLSEKPATSSSRHPNYDQKRNKLHSRSSTTAQSHARVHTTRRGSGFDHNENVEPAIPTAADLAESFLQAEPNEAKAELEAALLSETRDLSLRRESVGKTKIESLQESQQYPHSNSPEELSPTTSSDDGDNDGPFGTGTALTLPTFMASFLQGIVDRLQIRIHVVTINLDVDVPNDNTRPTSSNSTDPVTIQLKVDDIDIEGVTHELPQAATKDDGQRNVLHREGQRLIYLTKIRGILISEASLFSNLARSSAVSSPSAAHSVMSEERRTPSKPHSIAPESVLEAFDEVASSETTSATSSIRLSSTSLPKSSSDTHSLLHSVNASDGGRFDDAPEDEDNSNLSESIPEDLLLEAGASLFQNSVYSDQVTESRYPEDTEIQKRRHPSLPFADETRTGIGVISPLSTPRASIHVPSPPERPSSSFSSAKRKHNSTVLPTRQLPRFSAERVSQSQPSLPLETTTPTGESVIAAPHRFVSSTEFGDDNQESSDDDDRPSTVGGDDLARSQLFSHEDAESMYMSAVSHGSSSTRIAGGRRDSSCGSDDPISVPASPTSTKIQEELLDNLERARQSASIRTSAELQGMNRSSTSSSEAVRTPRRVSTSLPTYVQPVPSVPQASSNMSERSATSSDEYSRMSKQIFSLDQVAIYIPAANAGASADGVYRNVASAMLSSTFDGQSDASNSASVNIPGAFSVHIPPRPSPPKVTTTVPAALDSKQQITKSDPSIEVVVGQLLAQFDISVGRLLLKLAYQLRDASREESATPETIKNEAGPKAAPVTMDFKLSAEQISLKFLERLEGTLGAPAVSDPVQLSNPPEADVLLQTTFKGLHIATNTSQSLTKTTLTLKKFVFGYAQENIVCFDAGLQMRASVRDLKASAGIDLSVNISRTPSSTVCNITTLPMHVSIDLQRLDETFSWFGGLSSVLNLGSSIASNATITATSPIKPKARGVRFETLDKPEEKSLVVRNKTDVRIGGVVLDLVGTECSVEVETSAVKLVSRDEVIGVGISKIRLSGPHLGQSDDEPPITVDITATRIDYLPSPRDIDLDSLLSLITPSKAKYDQDDDILLDTLLRQRKQGAVLRVSVENFYTSICRLHELSYLPELGEEVSRLATVAKYLPDDDRPGLLSLITIHKFDANVDINDRVGTVQFTAKDIEVAQITIPALVALSVSSISAYRNGSEELLGAATDPELREPRARSPVLMARMIGDEMEPIVKVKLWNLKLEYRVPTLMTLLSLTENATKQAVSSGIAASVATLTDLARSAVPQDLFRETVKNQKSNRSSPSKPMIIDIILRDCVLGLNPLGLSSKVLVVLTETHLAADLPKDQSTKATAEMSKGSLLVIDNVANITSGVVTGRSRRQSFDGGSSQVADLCATGFVPVSYISSARAALHISTDENGDPAVDVELRDDLFVLESCADSTQTLIAVFGALTPPTLPSEDIKYRTKVIPVKDLLASLAGDAFGTAEGEYNFDDDFGDIPVSETGDGLGGDETEDLDFDSQYYQNESDQTYHEAILEERDESLSSIQVTSRDTGDGVLLESFLEPRGGEENDVLDFQEDHFGTGSLLEGTAHRWNSAKNTYDRSNEQKVRKSPLKVCVRDVHIIWNLFDGYDWQHTRDAITKAVQDVESKAIEKRARNERRSTFEQDTEDEETVIGDFLFNSIYIGIPANRDPRELAAAINQELNDNATETESIATTSLSSSPSRQGGAHRTKSKKLRLKRSKHHKITFELKGVCVDLVAFPLGSGETLSSVDIRVHDFEIFDHVPTSTWRKFATYMQDAGERESGSSMIHIELLNVRPVAELAASEIVIKATVLPLRLHVDQDALDFITRFFEFKDDTATGPASPGEVPFLQRVEVNSVQVKLDFKPKRVDYAGLRSGHTTEFMNFLILDEADMVLRHTIIYGISGFDKLGKCLNDIWMPEIKRNQLPGILAGLAPVRSLVNVGGGFRHLVVVPLKEYRKDGRIVRGISKGAAAFAKTTGTELVKLGAKVAIGVQTVLQSAEEFLGQPEDSAKSEMEDGDSEEERKQISLYANQPVGVFQGLRGGYAGLQRDLLLARDAIIAVPGEVMEGGTAAGVLRAVRKHAPTVILRPAIGVAKAGGQILMGATNSLDPVNLQRAEAKYKKH